ncbi:MAG: hypothetical protein IK081_06280 [Lachnospiraceae bacterium]|nr:hypothetical protein [Lachnospiraceae bacterium]
MGYLTIMEAFLLSLQAAIVVPIVISTAGLMKKGRNGIFPAFFTFAMMSLFLSDLYCLIFCIVRPEERMPFTVDEIAECAMLLLVSAGLEALSGKRKKWMPRAFLFTILYMSASIALWIAWSGEWVQDILFGLPYVYLAYLLVRGLEYVRAWDTDGERMLAVVMSVGILLMQTVMLITENETAWNVMNVGSYVIAHGITAWLLWKNYRSLRDKSYGEKTLYLSITVFLWTLLVTYMSDEIYYNIALAINTLTIPIEWIAVKRLRGETDGAAEGMENS